MSIQPHTDPGSISPAAAAALDALVRLLARQAAREFVETGVLDEPPDGEHPNNDPETVQ